MDTVNKSNKIRYVVILANMVYKRTVNISNKTWHVDMCHVYNNSLKAQEILKLTFGVYSPPLSLLKKYKQTNKQLKQEQKCI